MDLAFLADVPLARGIVLALLGVGFWVGGVVVAHLVWQYLRGRGSEEDA